MKDMGEVNLILGIRTKREQDKLMLIQSHYVEKIIKRFNHIDCNLILVPVDFRINYVKNKGDPVSQREYAEVIGCLIYAMTCTRSYIAYVVEILSKYTSNPSKEH